MTARADGSATGQRLGVRRTKDAWRRRLLAARRTLPAGVRAARARALAAGVVEIAAAIDGPICAYLPVGVEPGSPALVEALRLAGHEVWLPVVPGAPGPLDWARFDGLDAMGAGPLDLREPVGPRLGPAAVAGAGLVLVPGLAADRRGGRLGRGGGYYDRTMPLAGPGTPLVVVLNDEELVAEVPVEPHDRPVTAALLAEAGITMLGTPGNSS